MSAAGMSWLFNDRQFLCRAVGVAFPDGTRALAVYSPPDGTYPGDPGITKARTIRAHMGVSGYVVSPHAGEDRTYLGCDKCQITMVLQVDPRVSTAARVLDVLASPWHTGNSSSRSRRSATHVGFSLAHQRTSTKTIYTQSLAKLDMRLPVSGLIPTVRTLQQPRTLSGHQAHVLQQQLPTCTRHIRR